MKVFNRTSLPDTIKYNGKILKRYTYQEYQAISELYSNSFKTEILNKLKSAGKSPVFVDVLHRNLRVREDFHGKPYQPVRFIYCTE